MSGRSSGTFASRTSTGTPVPALVLNGCEIAYCEEGGESLAVGFLYGWPDSRFSFSRVRELVTAKRARMISLDLLGFGESDEPGLPEDRDKNPYTLKSQADMVDAAPHARARVDA